MKGFTAINRINLKQKLLKKAFDFLNYAGERNVEGIALFAGFEKENSFFIEDVIIPKQTSYILEQGLMYAVDGDELHGINVWLYENKMRLIAQIHSHPQQAYHSSADDRYPIVDTLGGISIVVPDFATGNISLLDWAVYRLSIKKTWDKLSKNEVISLFKIL